MDSSIEEQFKFHTKIRAKNIVYGYPDSDILDELRYLEENELFVIINLNDIQISNIKKLIKIDRMKDEYDSPTRFIRYFEKSVVIRFIDDFYREENPEWLRVALGDFMMICDKPTKADLEVMQGITSDHNFRTKSDLRLFECRQGRLWLVNCFISDYENDKESTYEIY